MPSVHDPLMSCTSCPVNTLRHTEPFDHCTTLSLRIVPVNLPASGKVTKKLVTLVTLPKAVGRFANDMSTTRLSPPEPLWMMDGFDVPSSVQCPVRLVR